MSDNILERIFLLMENDTEDTKKQSETLEAFYYAFDEKTKASIDMIVSCICGYSLDTIIYHPENISIGDGQ